MIGQSMMALGLFVFMLDTVPYQQLQHHHGWRYPSHSRIGLRPRYQYLGPDEETITLSGVLMPELTGGDIALQLLHAMADQGKAWPLIEGTGTIYGFYLIESIDTTRTDFFSDGKARRIEFTLNLKRIDQALRDTLGAATRNMLELIQ